MIPDFNQDGNLPPGIHRATWPEFERRFATNRRRRELMRGLSAALDNLAAAGCRTAYVNGSFVTAKEEPQDWDGCWDDEGVDFTRVDPVLLDDTWPRIFQKAKYRGEMFVVNVRRNDAHMLEYFQRDKLTRRPKGIIALDLQGMLSQPRRSRRG